MSNPIKIRAGKTKEDDLRIVCEDDEGGETGNEVNIVLFNGCKRLGLIAWLEIEDGKIVLKPMPFPQPAVRDYVAVDMDSKVKVSY